MVRPRAAAPQQQAVPLPTTTAHMRACSHQRNPPPRSIARALSMAELEEGFRGLLTRLPGLRLAVAPGRLAWSEPTRDVGLASLPVAW